MKISAPKRAGYAHFLVPAALAVFIYCDGYFFMSRQWSWPMEVLHLLGAALAAFAARQTFAASYGSFEISLYWVLAWLLVFLRVGKLFETMKWELFACNDTAFLACLLHHFMNGLAAGALAALVSTSVLLALIWRTLKAGSMAVYALLYIASATLVLAAAAK